MIVEKIKYTIWAVDPVRATNFYEKCFGATVIRQNSHIIELGINGSIIAIHGGGEGNRTWTGITFQVPDVIEGAQDVRNAGGKCASEPKPEGEEPPHLAMCEDTEGNQIMLSRSRS